MAEENNQDKGYEVKDKRRVKPDGSLNEETQPAEKPAARGPIEQPEEAKAEATEPETAEAATPEKQAEAPGADEEMPTPDVYQTLQFVAGLLVEQAWQFMGLHLPPGHKEPVQDLAQAKIAIDTIIFVSDKLHSQLDDEGRKAIRSLISDLQLNFVQQGQ